VTVARWWLVRLWASGCNSEQLQRDLVEGVAAVKADASIRRSALSGSV
jgi:hypothetical protein